MGSDDNLDWNKSIRSILKSSNVKEVKKLRKELFLSLQLSHTCLRTLLRLVRAVLVAEFSVYGRIPLDFLKIEFR